jgi:hypothetical protein
MPLSRRLFLSALIAAPPTLGRAAEAKPIVIPFLMPHDRPIMLVGINGKGPYRFIFDTGNAGPMQITASLARELKLSDTDYGVAAGVVGQAERTMFAADEVNFGGALRQRHVGFMSVEGFSSLGDRTQGLVASQFFLVKDCDIDFAARQIHIYLDGAPDRAGLKPIRLLTAEKGEIVVQASFNDIPCRLVVDTGANTALSLEPYFVARNRLWDAFPKFLAAESMGITGGARSRLVKGASLGFGPYKFRDPIVQLLDPTAHAEGEIDGLIGIDLLRRFTLSFAPDAHTLWIKPNDAVADPFRYDRGGMDVGFDEKAGQAVIAAVEADGSGAKAGFKVGDRLVDINTPALVRELDWRLSGFPGEAIEVSVATPGGPQKRTITLEDRL